MVPPVLLGSDQGPGAKIGINTERNRQALKVSDFICMRSLEETDAQGREEGGASRGRSGGGGQLGCHGAGFCRGGRESAGAEGGDGCAIA